MNAKVSIIMGSTSDMPIMQEAAKILGENQETTLQLGAGQTFQVESDFLEKTHRLIPTRATCCHLWLIFNE